MKYRTLWIKVQSHSVVKNLQQQWHTVLTMVTNLFLSLLIRLAIFSPCIALQYFLDDEFHMSCHSCAIPSLTSPWVSCKVSAFPNSNPLNLNFLIPTPSLLFMMYFQPWARQQSVTTSSLFDFNSSPPWKKKTFCSYSYKPTSPWFIFAEIQKETALEWYSNIFSASSIFIAVFSYSSSPTKITIFLPVQLRTTRMPKGPTVSLTRRK